MCASPFFLVVLTPRFKIVWLLIDYGKMAYPTVINSQYTVLIVNIT